MNCFRNRLREFLLAASRKGAVPLTPPDVFRFVPEHEAATSWPVPLAALWVLTVAFFTSSFVFTGFVTSPLSDRSNSYRVSTSISSHSVIFVLRRAQAVATNPASEAKATPKLLMP